MVFNNRKSYAIGAVVLVYVSGEERLWYYSIEYP